MTQKNIEIPESAIHCISGLIYLELKKGNDKEHPGPEDVVKAIITSPIKNTNDPLHSDDVQTLSLKETGAGLSEAFQIMTPGQKIRVWIPAALQKDPVKETKGEVVVYDIELIDFTRTKEPVPVPAHLVSPRQDK